MKKSKKNIFLDTWVMFKRCLTISLRNPETLLTATLIPFCLILLFGTVFGSISDVGDYDYIDLSCRELFCKVSLKRLNTRQ